MKELDAESHWLDHVGGLKAEAVNGEIVNLEWEAPAGAPSPDQQMHRIEWRVEATGYTGHGDWHAELSELEPRAGNRDGILHWIESKSVREIIGE